MWWWEVKASIVTGKIRKVLATLHGRGKDKQGP